MPRRPLNSRLIARSGLTALALALAGCGETDSQFAMDIHRSPDAVVEEIGNISLGAVGSLIPEAQLQRSEPSANEVLYTVPADNPADNVTIRFGFSALPNTAGTHLDVALHVPAIKIDFDGEHALSESRVESALHTALGHLAEAMEHNASTSAARGDLSALMTALSFVTHRSAMAQLKRLKAHPELASSEIIERMAGSGMFGGGLFGSGSSELGEGRDPTPPGGSGADPTPQNGPEGQDPTPENDTNGYANQSHQPMIRATGSAPEPTM